MIKAVIYDFDGVLVDSNEAWAEIYGKAMNAAGVKKKFTYDDIKHHYGKSYIEVFKGTNPKFKHNEDVLEVMYSNFLNLATKDEFLHSFNTIGGIKGSLAELKKRFKLAVGSGNSKRLLNRFLEKLGLMEYFDFVISGNDVKNGKPSPDMLLKVIEHFRIKPDEAVYVGDTTNDVIAAKRAKMRCVVVLTGALDREEAEQLKPDFIIEDATKLPEVLKCM